MYLGIYKRDFISGPKYLIIENVIKKYLTLNNKVLFEDISSRFVCARIEHLTSNQLIGGGKWHIWKRKDMYISKLNTIWPKLKDPWTSLIICISTWINSQICSKKAFLLPMYNCTQYVMLRHLTFLMIVSVFKNSLKVV